MGKALKRPLSTPSTAKKVGQGPAVIPAHEGQSVNPEMNALEDLTFTAAAKALEIEREEEAQDRKMRPVTAELKDHLGDEEAKAAAYRELICSRTVAEAGEEKEGGNHLRG